MSVAYLIVRFYLQAGEELPLLSADILVDAFAKAKEVDDEDAVAAIREAFDRHVRIKG